MFRPHLLFSLLIYSCSRFCKRNYSLKNLRHWKECILILYTWTKVLRNLCVSGKYIFIYVLLHHILAMPWIFSIVSTPLNYDFKNNSEKLTYTYEPFASLCWNSAWSHNIAKTSYKIMNYEDRNDTHPIIQSVLF